MSKRANTVIIGEQEFIFTPVDLCIKFSKIFQYNFYLPSHNNDKEPHVLISDQTPIKEIIFDDIKRRGLQFILLSITNYKEFSSRVKKLITKVNAKSQMNNSIITPELSRSVIGKLRTFGLKVSLLKAQDKYINNALEKIADTKLEEKLIEMKNERIPLLIKTVFNAYLLSTLFSKYTWASEKLISNVVQGALLAPLLLGLEEEQMISEGLEFENASDQIKELPEKTIEYILNFKNYYKIPNEAKIIIEQQFERPDGAGYPNQLTSQKINKISIDYITVKIFTDKLFEYRFDPSKKARIFMELSKMYQSNGMSESVQALKKII